MRGRAAAGVWRADRHRHPARRGVRRAIHIVPHRRRGASGLAPGRLRRRRGASAAGRPRQPDRHCPRPADDRRASAPVFLGRGAVATAGWQWAGWQWAVWQWAVWQWAAGSAAVVGGVRGGRAGGGGRRCAAHRRAGGAGDAADSRLLRICLYRRRRPRLRAGAGDDAVRGGDTAIRWRSPAVDGRRDAARSSDVRQLPGGIRSGCGGGCGGPPPPEWLR